MTLQLRVVTRRYVLTGPDGLLGQHAQSHATKEHRTDNGSAKGELLVRSDAKVMKHKLKCAMQVMVNTHLGQPSQYAVLLAREEPNQELEAIHARLVKQKQPLATQILELTINGVFGQHVLKHAEVVDNHEDVIILAEKMTNLRIKIATQIQVDLVNGLHGVNVLKHVEVVPRPDQEFTHVRGSKKLLARLATLTHVLSGVDGHSGDFAVQRVVKELGCDIDSAEEVQLEVASV